MKAKILLFSIMTVLLLAISACAMTPDEASVELSCDDFTDNHHIKKEIEIAEGSILTVTLCENRTTGFQWSETAQITDTAVLVQAGGGGYTESDSDLPGSAGKREWNFQALKKGTARVSLEYSQDWQGGLQAEWTFELTVVVK